MAMDSSEALAKVKPHISPSVYRALESSATEAIGLAEMAGSGGPQGTLHSTNSILGGSALPDRQVRRKADHIVRITVKTHILLVSRLTRTVS